MLKEILNFIQKARSKFSIIKMAEITPTLLGKRPAEMEEENVAKKGSKKKKKSQHVVQLGKSEGCKRKIAALVAYNGAGYYGVQINPGFPTIESEFFPALVKVGAIPQDHADTPSKMWFQRGSRTDKGVSAAGQIFSMKAVLVPDLVQKLNENLPPQIRVMGYVRTTNGFDSKNWCDSRTYMYMMPTFAFAPLEKFITDEYRTTPEILERVREVLKNFIGTHKFHNFTSGVKFEQASAARYIISFECSDAYVKDELEFVTIRVKGQSFMLHQIRKMIGLTIAIVRGYCGEDTITSSWGPEKVDIPKAPGLGLVLEELHFNGYNRKYGNDGVHEAIDWSQYKEQIEKFKEEHILSYIAAEEKKERSMATWLQNLQYHTYGERSELWQETIQKLKTKSQGDGPPILGTAYSDSTGSKDAAATDESGVLQPCADGQVQTSDGFQNTADCSHSHKMHTESKDKPDRETTETAASVAASNLQTKDRSIDRSLDDGKDTVETKTDVGSKQSQVESSSADTDADKTFTAQVGS